MFKIEYILPTILGVAAVVQGGLNRQIARSLGFGGATLLNAAVLFVAAILLTWLVAEFKPRADWSQMSWWFLVPGVLGLCFVAGVPLAISKIGALNVFLGLISAQMAASIAWDIWVEGLPLSWPRIAGVALTFVGVLVSRL